jgi:hypothetical protein
MGRNVHGLHTSASEIHSLGRVIYALMRGGPGGLRLVSMKAEDSGKHNGETCVMLNLAEEHRSNFEKFNPSS